jgi:hypothetical protein
MKFRLKNKQSSGRYKDNPSSGTLNDKPSSGMVNDNLHKLGSLSLPDEGLSLSVPHEG